MTRHDPSLSERLSDRAGQGGITALERRAVAAFVAELLGSGAEAALDLLCQTDTRGARLAPLVAAEAAGASRPGPYGRFPPGPLRQEDLDGPPYRMEPGLRRRFGARLASALERAHLLALHPADDGPAAQAKLQRAGWSAAESAALSEFVAFLVGKSRFEALASSCRAG